MDARGELRHGITGRVLLRKCLLALGLLAFCVQGSPSSVEAQATKNPLAGNPKAIAEGASQFRIDCALCHGLHAQGGNRGPDLTRGVWNHGGSDAEIFHTITAGVPGTLMPANDLSETETWEIVAYLRSLQPKSPKNVSGDREEGKQIFFGDGNCYLCHMVDGKGGRVGPDLSRVGASRSPEDPTKKTRDPNANLSGGLWDPGKEWPVGSDVVTVVTADGQTITGMLRNEDAYSIQLMDSTENLHLYLKKDLRSVTHEERTLMPAFSEDMLSNKQLGDLLAYLESLRGTETGENKR